jgi:aryl-alcohol dehydrogenase-like predicted oxidoreductase
MDNPLSAKRRLGRSGLYVTPLGLGGVWLGRTPQGFDEKIGVATVLRALELDINLIDTSRAYGGGRSERCIGIALEKWFKRGGRREDIILSTKTGTRSRPEKDYSAEGTKRSVEKSLELLKTDYLDVVLVHDPEDLAPVLAPGGALEALKEFKEKGIVRAIGLGVRSHELHRQFIETGECDVSLTYRDYNLLDQSALEGVLKIAVAHDVGVMNGMPIIKGLLGGGDPLQVAREIQEAGSNTSSPYYPRQDEVQRARALWEWANSKGVNLLALNLQFCLRPLRAARMEREMRIASTLVGASNPEEIEADVAAISEEIPEELWQELPERLDRP